MADFPLFCKYSKDDFSVSLHFSSPHEATEEEKDWMFELVKTNMREMYLDAGWGWDDGEKRRELVDDNARYIIAKDSSGKMVAFAHFRFLLEGVHEVLYLYELQLEPEAQRKGLGRRIMQVLELIAGKNNMKWVMLTVFTANEPGMSFYTEKMKYVVDEISPSRSEVMKTHAYEILSKCIDPELRKAYALSAGEKAVMNAGPTRRRTVDSILAWAKAREEAEAKAKEEEAAGDKPALEDGAAAASAEGSSAE